MIKSTLHSKAQVVVAFPYFIPLTGLYPVLYLLKANISQAAFPAAGQSLWMAFICSLVISGGCLWLVHPRGRAYLSALLFNTAFFSYGHLFNLMEGRRIGSVLIGRNLVFLPLFALFFAGLFLLIVNRPAPKASSVRVAANMILLGLCLFEIGSIALFTFSTHPNAPDTSRQTTSTGLGSGEQIAEETDSGPDIYYIILDGLSRADVLRDSYGYADYTLPQDLKKRGFYIPDCAFSNYGATAISLTSSLNFNYLDTLGIQDEQVNNETNDPPVLYNLLHQNQVVDILKRRGYQFVAFRGFFPLNDFQEADTYFNFFNDQQGYDNLAERSFSELFIRTTLLRLPAELYESSPQRFSFVPRRLAELIAPEADAFSSRSYLWYQEHLYEFKTLATVPGLPGKKFVYAHFYTTHQPYVFHPDGSLLWPIHEDNDGYVAAVQYTSHRILEVIDQILKKSARPPVIIIQADHGTTTGLDKYKILNAYYLPDSGEKALYPTITPVNTFRVILDQYAGKDYPLLPDRIFTSVQGEKQFVPVPAACGK